MNFALFLLLNVVLLIRPEELFPDIAGLRLYLIVICLCLLTSAPEVLQQLTIDSLVRNPITACVLGLLGAVVLSLVFLGRIGDGVDVGGEFGKVVLYYLLFVGVVNTPGRFRFFLGMIVALAAVLTTLSLLQYHEYIDVEALRPLERRGDYDPETGEFVYFQQLRASGLYNDPNDLCLILTTATVCCLARSATAAGFFARVLWLLPIGLFGYAIVLTKSRGGLLGLMAALFVLLCLKLGIRRGGLLGLIAMPLMVLVVGGRQASLNVEDGDDTAQARVQLWAEGLTLMWQNPMTGIGVGEYNEEVGQVAHNSFVHAYVETGLVGGTLFGCAFLFAVIGVLRVNRQPVFADHSFAFRRLQPFVVSLIVGYAAGLYSLSRVWIVPTYLVFALGAAYTRIALPSTPAEYCLSATRLRQMALAGGGGFVFLKLFTQVMLKLGS